MKIRQTWVPLIGRLIIAGVFAIACYFKFMYIGGTASQIASIGLPFSTGLAWLAAIFELLLILAFVTGICFRTAAVLGVVYVLFLGFAFHGMSHWSGNMDEFGFFVDHFTFAAALLFMYANGPGHWALGRKRKTLPSVA